jgi:PAS domain S-box-containing protein
VAVNKGSSADESENLDSMDERALEGISREQEIRRFRRAVEAAGHAFYVTDREGTIEWVNPAFEEITGYSADEVIGQNPRILKSGEMTESYYEELWEALLAGETWQEEIVNRRKNGTLYWAHQTIAPILDDNGEVEWFTAIQTDITERKEYERELEESLTHLQVIDRVLRHNLRNVLNIILSYAEKIQSEADGTVAESAAIIEQQSNQLSEIVDKERAIMRLLTTNSPSTPIDLTETLDMVVEKARERFPDAEFALHRPDDVTLTVIGSFRQALDELLTNAVIHSDQQTPSITIDVTANDDRVEIQIVDDGPGIPEIEQQILTGEMDPEPLDHGSGLGLWLVYLTVKKSGGTIQIDESNRCGSSVRIEIEKGNESLNVRPPSVERGN